MYSGVGFIVSGVADDEVQRNGCLHGPYIVEGFAKGLVLRSACSDRTTPLYPSRLMLATPTPTHRLLSTSFLWFIFRML